VTCALVFTSQDLPSALTAFKDGAADWEFVSYSAYAVTHISVRKVFRIGTVRYNWPMPAHASQTFSVVHCTDSEDLPSVMLVSRNL